MLASLLAGGVPNANAQNVSVSALAFNSTDDGLSIAGMFFAKLDMMHAKHMSGKAEKVRLRPSSQCTCIIFMFSFAPLQAGSLCLFSQKQTGCRFSWSQNP
jgi:hypothetical protein